MGALEEIRERWEKATPGPWETRTDDLTHDVDVVHDQEQVSFVASCGNKHEPRTYSDAEFIAHAPTDVARLLNAVEAVMAVHRIEYRDQWGRPTETCIPAYGGWCSTCGRFGGTGCPTVNAITSALEARP